MPRPPSLKVGDVFNHGVYGEYIITKYRNSKSIVIEFSETGFSYTVDGNSIKNNHVRDPTAKTIFGVACVGMPLFEYSDAPQAYNCWINMLSRCYNKENPSYYMYGGRGVTVCDEWKNFQNFHLWYIRNHIDGYAIEKDIRKSGEYSEETCVFVPQYLNNAVSYRKISKDSGGVGLLPHGRYRASMYDGTESKHLGVFDSWEAAHTCYLEHKEIHLTSLATKAYENGEITLQTLQHLMKYIEEITCTNQN